MDFAKVKKLVKSDKFIISHHARVRMFKRNISTDEIMEIIIKGEIIEDYAQDKPCPSALILGYLDNRPFHAVVAECDDHVLNHNNI